MKEINFIEAKGTGEQQKIGTNTKVTWPRKCTWLQNKWGRHFINTGGAN